MRSEAKLGGAERSGEERRGMERSGEEWREVERGEVISRQMNGNR
jgi:hypothetical protein